MSLPRRKSKPTYPIREYCGICKGEVSNGATHCPAINGHLVCYHHCFSCQYKETISSMEHCLYRQRIVIFALPGDVEHWTREHQNKPTDWLKNTYEILMSGYKKTPDQRFTRRAELAAIRGILFHRQFDNV